MDEKKISLSLPHSYLSGRKISKRDHILSDLFGPAETFLSQNGKDLSGIEISHFNDSAPRENIVKAIHAVWNAGLDVILHAHIPMELQGSHLADVYPWLDAILGELTQHQQELMFNVHTLSSETLDQQTLMGKTIENLKILSSMMENEEIPLTIAVEINRKKEVNDPSTNYENLVEICWQVDHPAVGIGWDIGHTYSNVLHSIIPKEPPGEFIGRVIHTHIHDLGHNGQTHWPLRTGSLPLDFYMKKLYSIHYTGFHTLELYPERFINVIDAKKTMLESISILKNWEP